VIPKRVREKNKIRRTYYSSQDRESRFEYAKAMKEAFSRTNQIWLGIDRLEPVSDAHKK